LPDFLRSAAGLRPLARFASGSQPRLAVQLTRRGVQTLAGNRIVHIGVGEKSGQP